MIPEIKSLLQPVSADAVCGVDLEYTQLLAGVDAYRLFGSDIPLATDTDWRAVRDKTLAALAQSHDLRLLAHLAAALVRIDGLNTFCLVITIADRWLGDTGTRCFPGSTRTPSCVEMR